MVAPGNMGRRRKGRWRASFLAVALFLLVGVEGGRNNRKNHQKATLGNTAAAYSSSSSSSSATAPPSPFMAKQRILKVPKRDPEFKGKICIGTNGRMSVPSNRDHHYRNLRDRYTNCTYVDGNLELTWIQDQHVNLSFLQHIREVTGYVLISHVDATKVIFPELQIIRGRTLFKINTRNEEFALIVSFSRMYSIEMPALRDVLSGSVGLFENYNLCHVKTINWKEIISGANATKVYEYSYSSPERECPPCHKNCEAGCWGEGEDNCQKFSKENCSPQCYQGRCFGPNPRECCHLFCAGGCTGPQQGDCTACKNFYDDGVCTQECPPMQEYNPTTYSWQPNPKGKYAYGATCVKNCPEHLLKDNGACVRTCPSKKKAVNGECVPCDGPCPKSCPGDQLINAINIDSFKDCTIIEGHFHILENSFNGYQEFYQDYKFGPHIPPMHPDKLEVFSTLKEVTGFINIQASHQDFRNLSYFRNLETIGGRSLHDYFSSLYIVKTSLHSLELKSLKKINSGAVAILENPNLCFAENINWDKIRKNSEHKSMLHNNKAAKDCMQEGSVCDEQCSKDGCWGKGSHQCLSCANYRYENVCIQNCSSLPGIYKADDIECHKCHEECGNGCKGPGANNCTTCKNFKDGPYCVSSCPNTKYSSPYGSCMPCHDHCVDGCTGPSNIFGAGGCKSCDKAIIKDGVTICLASNENCPEGYFYESVQMLDERLKALAGKTICRKCHPRCKICSGYGFHELVCQQCTGYKRGEQCEDECPNDHYADNETQQCIECHEECKGCTGPGPENCLICQNLKIYETGEPSNNSAFVCASKCPPNLPHRIYNSDSYCSSQLSSAMLIDASRSPWLIIMLVSICIILILATVYVIHCCRKVKVKEDALKMTIALTGLEDNEPLRPTNMPPNLAQLRIIKEAEMRRGGILGYGAFGTVYKGVWVPEGESSKIPVAIKVLREDTGANTSKEFLAEAYIMASVEHPNLLQLLAVCMTSQMMLVTQLMPLGCLLDFVRKNQTRVGSKSMLSWCTQIARGMAYLEEKRLVHRDLAARNVLVQTPACVKITDFGLAKLLDINEEEYKAEGGKMPIKWLALECIQHRIFTHKSDVWAFGVTVWELLTYGARPYDNIPARDVPELLENGERLSQPKICSIDVYMIMIKCWMLDAESRPGFKELEDDFARMSRDPGRYLAIPGDVHMRQQLHRDDMLRNYPSNEHSQTTEFDECMQPKSRAPFPSGLSSLSISPPPSFIKWPSGSHMTSDGSCAPQNQHNWNQERLRFAQNHGIDPNTLKSNENSDGSSIRYCGDSIDSKYKPGSDEYDSGRSQAHVGSVKLELPVDEDDYLVPSPQQTQTPSTYVELMGESNKSSDGSSGTTSVYRAYPDFSKTNIDNPEYLMSNDAPSQTLGIPTVSEIVQASTVEPSTSATHPTYLPQRSSEEESDHEYYNDFDRLQRELQPLHRKGETTV